jgi:hypothetical protein
VTSYRCQIFSAVTAIEIHLIFASSLNILIREPRRRLIAIPEIGQWIEEDTWLRLCQGPLLAQSGRSLGAKHGVRANVVCPGFVRTPLVDKQIPEQAKELGISEAEVVKHIMLKDTVDGEFTTVEDVAEATLFFTLFFAAFESNALTGQSLVVSHGWFMQ